MAKNETRRINPRVLAEDVDSYDALKAIPAYAPSNPAFVQAKVDLARSQMIAAQQAETQAEAAWKTARDTANAKEWAFHNLILGAKKQVIAQFGENSDEVQAVGLKKKSEYKAPQRAAKPPSA